MKDFKLCWFTHLSMSHNHCWPSAKLFKLAVSLGIIILPTLWVCQNKKYYYTNVLCLSLLGAWPKATAHSVSSPLQKDLGISLLVPWAFEMCVREWEGKGKQETGKAEQRCEVNYEKMNGNIYSYRRVGGGDLSITIGYIFLSWYSTTLSRKIWVTLKQFFFNISVWNSTDSQKGKMYREFSWTLHPASPNFIILHNYSTLSKPGNWFQQLYMHILCICINAILSHIQLYVTTYNFM